MEIFEGKKMTDETLTGVSSISQLNDDSHAALKPSLDGTVGDDPGSVVVTETVVETTEVSVKVVQDGREDEVMKNVEQGEVNEGMENEIEGLFGNFVGGDDDDEGVNVNCNENEASVATDVEGSLADEDASRDAMDICLPVEKPKNDENGNRIFDDENGEENGKKSAENEGELDEKEESHNFVVGDFVWAKIKSHPWWPGQIYDPSDASDNAAKMKHKGQILVAHFGDGSFSWCSPSQLKPFIDHFPEMSKQSDSKKFVNAVQVALEEIGKLVEVGLMCKCQTVNRVHHAVVVNKGIKKGVPVPKGNTVKVLMERIEPVEIVSTLKDLSAMDPGTGLPQVELTLLKSCLNAFYSKKGGYSLVKFHDPKCIEGLEDNPRKGVVADFDINGDDKRNQKSVAELLKEDEPTIKKTKTFKDGSSSKRKRKALVVSVTPENDQESVADGVVEEETLSSRQRKKSKYLSPPYLSPVGNGRPELEQVLDAKHLEDSVKKSSGKKSRKVRGVSEGSDSQEEQKALVNGDVNVKKMLNGLLRVALDPASLMEENLPVVTDFVSSYRSSSFKEASNHQTDKKKNAQTNARGTSDLVFIKQKLETMMEIVKGCDETEMKADVKASLEGGIQEVLQKVGKMKGK